MIIISGEVLSLGGGIVEPGGEVRLVTDREVPSLLPGVKLTLVASGKSPSPHILSNRDSAGKKGYPT